MVYALAYNYLACPNYFNLQKILGSLLSARSDPTLPDGPKASLLAGVGTPARQEF